MICVYCIGLKGLINDILSIFDYFVQFLMLGVYKNLCKIEALFNIHIN